MDASIPQALTRKHPSTIPASTVKPVAVSRTTNVVAVIQTSGSQRLPHSTVQDHEHTRKEAVQKLIHQFETHPKKRWKPTWSKITRSIQSASSRRKWSTAWETWSTSRFAKSLPKCSAATVWRTGRKALKTVLAGRACDPQTKIRKPNKDRYDVLSIPNAVMKAHITVHLTETHRTKETITQPMCQTKKAKKNGYKSILDRFLNTLVNNIGWNEEHCARYDAIAAEDRSYIATAAERFRRENIWVLVLNSSGPNGPMNQREDYHEAINIKDEESGKANTRLHPSEQVRQRPGQPFAWHDEGNERVDPRTGWRWYFSTASSSSSSTCWKSSEKWWQAWSWDEQCFSLRPMSTCWAYRQWRFTCKRRGV